MDDRLCEILADLADIELELDGIIYILELLEAVFEFKNNCNARNSIHVFDGQIKHMRKELMRAITSLDEYSLGIND